MKAVVGGLLGSYPVGGMAFHYLQYMLGLRSLGWKVGYVEDTGRWFYDPAEETFVEDASRPVRYLETLMRQFGFADAWSLRDPEGRWHGPVHVGDLFHDVDLFLNVSGACWLRPEHRQSRRVVYVDTDPGYSQFKAAAVASGHGDPDQRYSVERMAEHHHHATFGENVGQHECGVPTDLFDWIPTRQPIVLDLWPVKPAPTPARFSTVLSWAPYLEPIRFGEQEFWGKQHEFERMMDLPSRVDARFEVAIAGEAPEKLLRDKGWQVTPATSVSHSPDSYRRYIQSSTAEFSVAKDAYVATRSGWFSERSACYLASGRPVVVQDTGFTDRLSEGMGVHGFRDVEEAASGVKKILAGYEQESLAARAVAEDHFEARKVLGNLLSAIDL